jgi:sortase A
MRYFSLALGVVGIVVILYNGYWFWKGVSLSEEPRAELSHGDVIHTASNPVDTRTSVGEQIGTLLIPALELSLPVYSGTSEKELKQGVGHYLKSGMPGEKRHTVLTGHRDTVFRKLENIKINDGVWVHTGAGKFLYKVHKTKIVEKNDRTVLVEKPIGTLSLVTCYPFQYAGNAPQRFIVEAKLIETDD